MIVSGLPEAISGSIVERKEADREIVTEMASTIGIEGLDPEEVARIGRANTSGARILRFNCESTKEKFELLKKAKDLQNHPEFKSAIVNPDLTKSQRITNKALRDELNARRTAGESAFIVEKSRINIQALKRIFTSSCLTCYTNFA